MPLECAEGWANVVGHDLNVCPDCQRPVRVRAAAMIAERLHRHGMLPKATVVRINVGSVFKGYAFLVSGPSDGGVQARAG